MAVEAALSDDKAFVSLATDLSAGSVLLQIRLSRTKARQGAAKTERGSFSYRLFGWRMTGDE